MANKQFDVVELVTWREIRDKVLSANPTLAKIIDDINPSDKYPFVWCSYPFGVDILKFEDFHLPETKEINKLNLIKQQLNYAPLPIGINLNRAVEIYYETKTRVLSDKLWKKGSVFGLWELFDDTIKRNTAKYACISSGARTIFMLPKISDQLAHRRLQTELDITTQPPVGLPDHRNLFAAIAKNINSSWRCNVLYFGKQWYQEYATNKKLSPLKDFFYQEAWEQSYNCRQQFEINIVWEDILHMLNRHNLYMKPHLVSHLKQLYSIAEGIFPSVVFANNTNHHAAPIAAIQKVYQEIYRLKSYLPIMMHPGYVGKNSPAYYSLNFPNYFEPYIPFNSNMRIMEDLGCMIKAIDLIKNEISLDKNIDYAFYHSNSSAKSEILSASEIIKSDNVLRKNYGEISREQFAQSSPFFKGCIKIIRQ